MNRDPHACADIRALLADHLDGLLDEVEAARACEHLAGCATCAVEADRVRRVQAALTAPWDVPAPSPDLPLRALASARARASRFGCVAGTALRYAATFAAGVLVTLLVLRAEGTPPVRAPVEVAEPAPAPPPAPEPVAPSFSPRRIR